MQGLGNSQEDLERPPKAFNDLQRPLEVNVPHTCIYKTVCFMCVARRILDYQVPARLVWSLELFYLPRDPIGLKHRLLVGERFVIALSPHRPEHPRQIHATQMKHIGLLLIRQSTLIIVTTADKFLVSGIMLKGVGSTGLKMALQGFMRALEVL